MTSSPSDGRPPAPTNPGASSRGELLAWIKFAWTAIGQVDGFVPKLRAVVRVIKQVKR